MTKWKTQVSRLETATGIFFVKFKFEDLPPQAQDITYDLSDDEVALLNLFAADGEIALGFDPDCHFYNNGITFFYETTQETTNVPEPASLVMMATAAVSMGAAGIKLRRRTHKK